MKDFWLSTDGHESSVVKKRLLCDVLQKNARRVRPVFPSSQWFQFGALRARGGFADMSSFQNKGGILRSKRAQSIQGL